MGDAVPTPVLSARDLEDQTEDQTEDIDLDDTQILSDLTLQVALQQADQESQSLS
jgi:hypothetical protein